jgi:hypothetical protein
MNAIAISPERSMANMAKNFAKPLSERDQFLVPAKN